MNNLICAKINDRGDICDGQVRETTKKEEIVYEKPFDCGFSVDHAIDCDFVRV